MPKPRNPIPAETISLPLGAELALDLEAFCQSNRGQPAKVRIIREAIRDYIDAAIAKDDDLLKRFGDMKAEIAANVSAGTSIRLVRPEEKEQR